MHILKTTTPAFLNTITQISDKNLQENSIPWNEYNCSHQENVSVWLLVVWLQGTATGLQMGDRYRATLCVWCPILHSSHTLKGGHLLAVVSFWDISITISG